MLDFVQTDQPLNTAGISRALSTMFPACAAVAVLDPRLDQGGLLGIEWQSVTQASPTRLREFTAGRVAARLAMLAMGKPAWAVPVLPDRSPDWPKGLTGSISHCAECCVAVLAPGAQIASLGVDIETSCALEPELFSSICTRAELLWLQSHAPQFRGQLAKLIFCAKEAAYKCQYPISHQLIGFECIEISFNMEQRRFAASFTCEVTPFQPGDRMTGAFDIVDGLILTGAALGT